MDFIDSIISIIKILSQFTPLFRVIWIVTVGVGFAMLIIAFVLKKNPLRKKSPWIVGSLGFLLMLSSGTQLITSIL